MPFGCTLAQLESDLCLSLVDHSWLGILVEIFIFFVAFCGLAIAAEHLCNSMETLCDHWRIHEDVGGATFIAFGGAIPEITINCVSTFKSVRASNLNDSSIADLGVGAILGSGLIAFLLIPALSCLWSNQKLLLRKRALYRDATFYALAVSVLMSAVYFGITTFHAPILVAIYICYVLVLVFGDHLHFFWSRALGHPLLGPTYPEHCDPTSVFRERYSSTHRSGGSACGELDAIIVPLLSLNGGAEIFDSSTDRAEGCEQSSSTLGAIALAGSYVVSPIQTAIDWTCPDCRIFKPKENWYPLTFLTALAWITMFSFVITMVVERWVTLMNLPSASALFGLILVAAGAEIPDTVNAVTIARRGFGGMAIGACLGSQVINICLGLGMPWLITWCFGKTVPLSSSNSFIHEASVLLLAAVGCVVVTVALIGPVHTMGRSEITKNKAFFLIAWYCLTIGLLGYLTVST